MDTIKTVPHHRIVTTGMPGNLRTNSASLPFWREWIRITGSVSVTIPANIAPERVAVHAENFQALCRLGANAGATVFVVHWGPWNYTSLQAYITGLQRPIDEYFFGDQFSLVVEQERAYWLPLLRAAELASREAGMGVIGLADTELWSSPPNDAAKLSKLYREAESWWNCCFLSPNYWYGFGDVRRKKRNDGVIESEATYRFPSGYTPTQAGRAAPSYYHLGDPPECLWRMEQVLARRKREYPDGTLPYGAWLSLSSSSTDGKMQTTSPWPARYTRCCAEYLRQQIQDGWIDRVVLWQKQTDWTNVLAIEHLRQLCESLHS